MEFTDFGIYLDCQVRGKLSLRVCSRQLSLCVCVLASLRLITQKEVSDARNSKCWEIQIVNFK